MAQSLAQVYLHIIFSTKHRVPLIDKSIDNEQFKYIAGICRSLECPPIEVGGHLDHVHISCKLSRKIAIMKLIEEIKKSSSKWIKTKGSRYSNFYWQDGYAVFSVNPTQVNHLTIYIQNQEEHHKTLSFKDECRRFFKQYGVEYDERYVWD